MGILDLPDEVFIQIFQYLPISTLLECEKVNRRWCHLAKDRAVWNKLVVAYSGKEVEQEAFEANHKLISGDHSILIRHIRLHYIDDYHKTISMLRNCPNLIKIECFMCMMCKDIIDDIKEWPKLKWLHLVNCIPNWRQPINPLFKFDFHTNLNSIMLSNYGLTNDNFESFLSCDHLTRVNIEKIRSLSLENIHKLLESKKDTLRSFHFYGDNAVGDETMLLISKCQTLQELAIIRCENLTDGGLRRFSRMPNLRVLRLWNNSKFSENGLLHAVNIQHFPKLETLSFSRVSNVTAHFVNTIADQFKVLKFISLYQCPLVCIDSYEQQLTQLFPQAIIVTR